MQWALNGLNENEADSLVGTGFVVTGPAVPITLTISSIMKHICCQNIVIMVIFYHFQKLSCWVPMMLFTKQLL